MISRTPYRPASDADWRECWEMTCAMCAHAPGCRITEAMIEAMAGERDGWPEDGWVTDPGAGMTCLSYEPRPGRKLSRQQVRRLARMNPATLPTMCPGCAARKGSEASVSLHTRRDFNAAVREHTLFICHQRPGYCGGWVQAMLARRKGAGR